MNSILDYFPGTPRPVQEYALKRIEEVWDSADVIVVSAPVASGKSLIALTLSRWQAARNRRLGKSVILTPSNILVDQYLQGNPRLHSLSRKDSYRCHRSTEDVHISCAEGFKYNPGKKHCANCPYLKAMRKAHAVPYGVYNYHIYLAHRLYSPTIIVDEAHNLINVIRDRAARKLWHFEYKFPSWVNSYSSLLRWVERHPRLGEGDAKLDLLHRELTSGKPSFLIERGQDLYRGREEECLKLLPLNVSNEPPIFWPTKVNKVVLLSATIGRTDIEDLGLDRKRVSYVETPSPIPVERRPILYQPVGSMALRNQPNTIPRLAEEIRRLLKERPEKGFIHATYSVAEQLREYLHSEPRLLWHGRENRTEQYERYREAPTRGESGEGGAVLIASGLYEGVDLPEELGRWQVITKVPYPSLAEPAIRYRAEGEGSKWYAWETIKTLLQASGRICRTPTDYGETLILDSSFKRLFTNNEELFPKWWKDSLVGGITND